MYTPNPNNTKTAKSRLKALDSRLFWRLPLPNAKTNGHYCDLILVLSQIH
jgi:hypothetical protein